MIVLPWPSKYLSPNTRCHWAQKAKHTKAARTEAGWATKASGLHVDDGGYIDLHVTFRPPDKRHRDLDNCVASCKGIFDGIADGLGVNDNKFRLHLKFGEVQKGGKVIIEIVKEKS